MASMSEEITLLILLSLSPPLLVMVSCFLGVFVGDSLALGEVLDLDLIF